MKKYIKVKDFERFTKTKTEIGDEAVWTLNSAKEGNGVWQLRDDNTETFWQSDGPIPHKIDIKFQNKTKVTDIAIYLDIKTDESYTPEFISIRAGIHPNDYQTIVEVDLEDPAGWIVIPLKINSPTVKGEPFSAVYYQIKIKRMFHQGKDTHVRLVKIFTEKDKIETIQNQTSVLSINNMELIR